MRHPFFWPALGAILATTGSSAPTASLAELVGDTPPGAVLTLSPGQVFRLSVPLVLARPIAIDGRGARIVAADGARITGALIRSTGVDGVRLSNLIVDANVDRDGADYGIWITGGDGHRIAGTTIRNSSQACLYLEDAVGTIEDNTLERCGRDLTILKGTAANDHGIMVAALTRAVRSVVIRRNVVDGAWRKGITTYARAPGSLSDVTIVGNRVANCGLGGIYVANAPGAAPQRDVVIADNTVERSYVNFQVDDIAGLTMTDNRSSTSRDRSGRPGAQGLVLTNVDGATVRGMTVRDSGSSGVLIRDSTHVRVIGPVVIDPNGGGNAFAPGIHFSNTRNSSAEDVSVVDDRARSLATHGIVENDGSRDNVVTVRRIDGILRRVLVVPKR